MLRAPPPRSPAAATIVVAAAFALHVAVAWLLGRHAPVAPHAAAPIAARVSLRWLPPQVAASQRPADARPRSDAGAAAAQRRTPGGTAPSPTRAMRTMPTSDAPADEPDAAAASPGSAVPAGPAATGVPPAAQRRDAPPPSLLDSPATRQAIRDAARAPSLADLDGTTPRMGASQQLGASIASGARGDCDKGEYAGGGMGLLSLPFWAIAKLRERCGK